MASAIAARQAAGPQQELQGWLQGWPQGRPQSGYAAVLSVAAVLFCRSAVLEPALESRPEHVELAAELAGGALGGPASGAARFLRGMLA
jgi:hypothetical protein